MTTILEQIADAARGEDPAALQALVQQYVQEQATASTETLQAQVRTLTSELEQLRPLRDRSSKESEETKALRTRLEKLEKEKEASEAGVDNDEVEKLANERANRLFDAAKQALEGQITTLKAEKAAIEESLTVLQPQVKRTRTENEILRVAEPGEVHQDLWSVLLDRVEPFFTFEDGKVLLKDPETKAILQGREGPMKPRELLDALRESKGDQPWNSRGAALFVTNAGGSGSRKSESTVPAHTQARKHMTPKQKTDFINQHGLDAFKALPAE